MKYFLGIDGGGTKTAFLLSDAFGKSIYRCETGPSRNKELSINDEFFETIKSIFKNAGIDKKELTAVCFGMPGYGENIVEDEVAKAQLCDFFKETPCRIVNDVEVGWAAALALKPGINVVSGTGSISYGKDIFGRSARSGGWWSNEGSGWWIGYKTIEIFLKQLDGRMEKTQLHDILWDAFEMKNKEDIFAYTKKNLKDNRKNIAAIQIYLDQAAEAGDRAAIELYEWAGHELALIVIGCYNQLQFKDTADVSYTGSVFKAGRKILDPFRKELGDKRFKISAPLLEPVQGAVLLAVEKTESIEALETVKRGI